MTLREWDELGQKLAEDKGKEALCWGLVQEQVTSHLKKGSVVGLRTP